MKIAFFLPIFSPFFLLMLNDISGQPRVYGVAKQENAQIKCIVDANPPEVDFKWTFNNSAESIDVAASHVSRHGELQHSLSCPSSDRKSSSAFIHLAQAAFSRSLCVDFISPTK